MQLHPQGHHANRLQLLRTHIRVIMTVSQPSMPLHPQGHHANRSQLHPQGHHDGWYLADYAHLEEEQLEQLQCGSAGQKTDDARA